MLGAADPRAVRSAGRYAAAVEPTTGHAILTDFVFASGESLPELRLAYTTLGQPRRDGRSRTAEEQAIQGR